MGKPFGLQAMAFLTLTATRTHVCYQTALFPFTYCDWCILRSVCRVYIDSNADSRLLPNGAISTLFIVPDWYILYTFLDCAVFTWTTTQTHVCYQTGLFLLYIL